MNSSVKISSYLPQEKRERSKLQQVKDKYRSFTQANKGGIPKDLNELKAIKAREHALTFLNQYMNINKKTSKSQYCKTHHISHNTLNTGLKQLGYKVLGNGTNRDQSGPVETNRDQLRPVKKIKAKKGKTEAEVKAGRAYEDEEINKMINNSIAHLSVS